MWEDMVYWKLLKCDFIFEKKVGKREATRCGEACMLG